MLLLLKIGSYHGNTLNIIVRHSVPMVPHSVAIYYIGLVFAQEPAVSFSRIKSDLGIFLWYYRIL